MQHRRHETATAALMLTYGVGIWANLDRECLRREAHYVQQLVLTLKPLQPVAADMRYMTLLAAY